MRVKSTRADRCGKWYLEGFGTSPGGTKPVAGKYTIDEEGCSGQVKLGLHTSSGDQEQEGVVHPCNQ